VVGAGGVVVVEVCAGVGIVVVEVCAEIVGLLFRIVNDLSFRILQREARTTFANSSRSILTCHLHEKVCKMYAGQ